VNRDDIIRMAREAGWSELGADLWGTVNDGVMFTRALQRFADLAVAAEREACAKVCEDDVQTWSHPGSITREECAAAIRARGQA
jgi:hypothetical protein